MSHVPNALQEKDNIKLEIVGMAGIPEKDRIAHELHTSGRTCSLSYGFFHI